MNELNYQTQLSRLANLLFFVVLLVFWGFFYSNHLVQKEQMQLFLLSFDYLKEHLSYQGGFVIYLGEFFTQFFRFTWAAVLFTTFFIYQVSYASQKVLSRFFNSKIYLLAFVPAMGYNLLLLNIYFKLSGAIAVALSVWGVVFYLKQMAPVKRMISGFILIVLCYWMLGGTYISFALSIVLIELFIRFKKAGNLEDLPNSWMIISGYVLIGIVTPLFFHKFVLIDTLLSSFISSAYYQFSPMLPTPLLLIFLSLPAILLFHGFADGLVSFNNRKILQPVLGILLFFGFGFGLYHLADFEEEIEIQYENLVTQANWAKIINLAEQETPTGEKGKLALTLALGKTEQLSSKLFSFSPEINDLFIPFNIRGMAPLIANEPYFYLGLTNFSKMLCIETLESTPDGRSPVRMIKRYAENCIIDGQYDVAAKYLHALEQTLFYRKWANEAQKYIRDEEKINDHQVWGDIRNNRVKDDFYFNYDQIDLALIALLRSNPQNKMAYEYIMSWYLLQKDFDEFLNYLPLVKTMGYHELPLVFQEALVYIKTLFNEVPENLNQYKISNEVRLRLNKYAKAFQQGGSKKPDEMGKAFGKTYWYYVHFTELENE
ncbi:DUF6057 family protein [Prolixibacteraceae bacterium Z1-6]|uniref:DUF6057 family protein n=1 Tax=Draconibacterium aestuarii TaxID=2998507 RepID=A0A9X3J8D1_9BACT|nr:DUF6057 family protein [Prolixibacteraceae bacterium Z1-6]